MENPITDTLWTRCLFELLPVRKQQGAKELELVDVDALVLEKSKLPTVELLKFLGHNK